MVINSIGNQRTRWLNIVIVLNILEISAFFFVGLISLDSSIVVALGLLTIAAILGYHTKELVAIN